MAIQRNPKLVRGNYDRLSDEEKEKTIKLNNSYYVSYPIKLEQNKFALKRELLDQQKETQLQNKNQAKAELEKEIVANDFKSTSINREKFFEAGSSLLQKDKRFILSDSPEMLWVKKSLAALNNVLDSKLVADGLLNQNSNLDSARLLKKVNSAYEAFFEAAQNYIDSRPSTSKTATRRRNQVIDLLNSARQAKQDFNTMIDAVKDNLVDFESMSEEQKANLTPRNLVTYATTKEAVLDTIKWQNEGNSTDVYRIELTDDQGRHYYLKENLPFINEDLPGFISRRTAQLNRSLDHLNSSRLDKVEKRLSDANVSPADYNNCINLLGSVQREIDNTSDAKKYLETARLSGIFARNFDRIFDELRKYNEGVDIIKNIPDSNLTLDQLIQKAKDDGDVVRQEMLEFRKDYLIKNNLYQENKAANEGLEKKNAADFLIKEMGLDRSKDREIIDQLKGMDDAALEKMFRFTLGKEVELFGQMHEKSLKNGIPEKDESIQAAKNNTATSKIAERYGFDDVITKSKTVLVKYRRRDETVVNKLCTISEEAPGTEYIDLVKKAQNENKKIVYSPEAMRGLMRLQANDTLTLQIDRHGRNFKCQFREEGNRIIIDTVKAYDNDMSFGNEKLADVFKENENGVIPKYQFLPSPTMKVKQDTALYRHIMNNNFGIYTDYNSISEDMKIDFGGRYSRKLDSHSFQTFMKMGSEFADFGKYTIGEITLKLEGAEREKFLKDHNLDDDKYSIEGYAEERYLELISNIKKIWLRSKEDQKQNKALKRKGIDKIIKCDLEKDGLDEEKRAELSKNIEELRQLQKDFNFKSLSNPTGDINIPYNYSNILISLFDHTIGASLDYRINNRSRDPEAIKRLLDNDGNLVLPAMLHYDKEAYDQLLKSKAELEDPQSNMVIKLKELGFSDAKIQALKERNEEMIKQITEASEKAQDYYKACGWTKEPKCKFFLERKDYKNFKDLTELAIDPGTTYLAIENDNFLCARPEYKKYMVEKEKKEAENYVDAQNKDIKRWKYQPGEVQKKYDENALAQETACANVHEYFDACLRDEEYSRMNEPLAKDKIYDSVCETIFINMYRDGTAKNGLNITRDKAQRLFDPESLQHKEFDALRNNPGKPDIKDKDFIKRTFFVNLKNKVEKTEEPITTQKACELRDAALKKTVRQILEAVGTALKDDKVVDKPKMIDELAKRVKTVKDYAKEIGSKLDVSAVVNNFAEKYPEKLPKDEIIRITSHVDGKEIQHNNPDALKHVNNNLKK